MTQATADTTMVRDLDITLATAAWTVTVYTLAPVAAVVPLGRLGDRIGHRRLLVTALGRLQGAQALVFASGPVIGGLLISGPGWRWVFAIITPLALIGLGLIVAFVPKTQLVHQKTGLDLLPSLLLAGTASAFVIAGVQLGGSTPLLAVAWVAVSAVVGVASVRADRRTAEPLLDPDLHGRRRDQAGLLGGFLCQYGPLAVSVVLLTYFQVGPDQSAQAAGIAFLPVSIPLLSAAWVSLLVTRFGSRTVVTAGLTMMATASLITGALALERQYLLMIPCLVLVGLGIALTGVPVQALTVAEPPESIREPLRRRHGARAPAGWCLRRGGRRRGRRSPPCPKRAASSSRPMPTGPSPSRPVWHWSRVAYLRWSGPSRSGACSPAPARRRRPRRPSPCGLTLFRSPDRHRAAYPTRSA